MLDLLPRPSREAQNSVKISGKNQIKSTGIAGILFWWFYCDFFSPIIFTVVPLLICNKCTFIYLFFTSRLGTGKSITFFYSVQCTYPDILASRWRWQMIDEGDAASDDWICWICCMGQMMWICIYTGYNVYHHFQGHSLQTLSPFVSGFLYFLIDIDNDSC